MREPRRIRDQAPESFEAGLLDALREEQPDPGARARALAVATGTALALHAQLTVSADIATGTAAHAAPATLKAGLFAKGSLAALTVKSAFVISGAGALLSAAIAMRGDVQPTHAARSGSHVSARADTRATHTATAVPTTAPEIVVPPLALPAARTDATRRRPAGARPRASLSAQSQAGSLAREVTALATVKRALGAGDPGRALAALTEYDATFPGAALAQEAEVLRVESLAKLGRHGEALTLAASALGRSASGPYSPRLRALLREQRSMNDSGIAQPDTGQ